MNLRLTQSRIKRWLKFNKASEKIKLLLAILLLGGLVYGLVVFWPEKQIERIAESPEEAQQVDTFERVMTDGTLNETIQFINSMSDDHGQEIPVRIEKLRNKFDLAQRIVHLSEDDDSLKVGQLNGLEARFALERLFNSNDLSTAESQTQFRDQLNELARSDDPEIARLTNLGQIYNAAFNIDDGKSETVDELTNLVQQLNDAHQDDSLAVLQLLEYATELRDAGRPVGAQKLVDTIAEVYRDSTDKTIAKVVGTADAITRSNKYQLSGNFRDVTQLQKQVYKQYSEKAANLITSITADPEFEQPYHDLLNCAVMITQAGFPDRTKKLIDKTKHLFDHQAVQQVTKQRYVDLDTIVRAVGSKLELPDTVKKYLPDRPSVVLLTTPASAQKLHPSAKQIAAMTKVMVADEKINVLAVYMEDGSNGQSWTDFSRIMSEFSGVHVVQMSAEDTTEFRSQYPIGWMPIWILLDDRGQLSQIGPPIPILEKMLLESIK